jgi:hypothetical protein
MLNGLSWFSTKYKTATFEDIHVALKEPENFILINTLINSEQDCLIKNTISSHTEETQINNLIQKYEFKRYHIIVYGKNATDESADKKCSQLVGLGFSKVYLYRGGMFEWMLLQDIYGKPEFPTTTHVLDILKFRGTSNLFLDKTMYRKGYTDRKEK